MRNRGIMVGLALLIGATQASAQQQRGTLEFGGFASSTDFHESLGMGSSWGAGARFGAFLAPRLSVEFEAGGLNTDRTRGLRDVNVGILSARLTAVPLRVGRVSLLVGAGADHTDTYVIERFGVHGLVGAKLDLTNALALRLAGTQSFMVTGEGSNRMLQIGVSAYRSPFSGYR